MYIHTYTHAEDTISVGAGGAITVLSDPGEEWREMLLKAHTVVNPACELMLSEKKC